MRKLVSALALMGFSAAVGAQIPNSNFSSQELQRLKKIGEDAASAAKSTPSSREEELKKEFSNLKRRADTIASEALQADRESLLDFLGIDPVGSASLYYFVSFSMPIEILRSYAMEAMWSGGTLVFRGIPEDRDVGTFILQDMARLFNGKLDVGAVSLDPRLFQSYGVDVVPTIVLTKDNSQLVCTAGPSKVYSGDKAFEFQNCPPLDESKFIKISGAVNTDYALRTFIENGFTTAKKNLDALARGSAGNPSMQKNGKEQTPYTGEWSDFISPSERKAAQEAASTLIDQARKNSGPDLSVPADKPSE